MAKTLDKNKTYLVLNYNPSPVAISTKDRSFLIPGGSTFEPASYPFDMDEIHFINNASKAFKIGLLRFEKEYEEAIYDELRIYNWKSILTEAGMEDIILNPTTEGLELLLSIQDRMYFERAYGVYLGLKNEGYPISGSVERVMTARRKELSNGRVKTDIKVSNRPAEVRETEAKMAEMQKQLDALTAMLVAAQEKESADSPTVDEDKPAPKRKPAKNKVENEEEE